MTGTFFQILTPHPLNIGTPPGSKIKGCSKKYFAKNYTTLDSYEKI
jgi:hypothetical protein